jgi:hypothetical protein
MQILKSIGVLVGCLSLTVSATAPAFAAAKQQRAGKPSGQAKTSVNRPPAQKASVNHAGSGGGNHNAGNRSAGNQSKSVNRNNQNKVSNQQAYKAGQASSNRNKKDVVVVNPGGGGYYDNNGRYYDNDRYDDDDNDFLEFVGKTAAITAGVSVVAAVIGSTTNEKPDNCQPVNSNGQSYICLLYTSPSPRDH